MSEAISVPGEPNSQDSRNQLCRTRPDRIKEIELVENIANMSTEAHVLWIAALSLWFVFISLGVVFVQQKFIVCDVKFMIPIGASVCRKLLIEIPD